MREEESSKQANMQTSKRKSVSCVHDSMRRFQISSAVGSDSDFLWVLLYGSKFTWKVVRDRPDPALTLQSRMVRGPCGPPPKA
jgi:hypothetical protein